MRTSRTLALLLTLAALPGSVFAFELDELMRALAARSEASATFVEEQHLATLDRPLRASGELHYRAPDTLVRETRTPREEVLRYEAGQVSVERRGRRTSVDVQRYPQILPLVESIRATLAGDRAALERLFDVTLTGERDAWRLRLVPHGARSRLVSEIRVDGRDADIVGVTLDRDNGDRVITTLTPAAP
jgi:outer membrane lipoprotein-sorting protein